MYESLDFEKVVKDSTGGNAKIKQSNYLLEGLLPVVDQGQELIAGYVDDESLKYKGTLPCVIFGDHTCILKYVDFNFVLGADGTKILVPDSDEINAKYLYYFLNTVHIPDRGYSRHFKYLKRCKIPVVSLSEQKQIVQTLDTADALRQKRKEQLNLLDEYLKSVFFEMFGDPIQNDKGWEIFKFGDICPTRLGKMLDAKKHTGRNPKQYLRNQNVLWGKFNLNELAIMDFDLREQKEFRLIKGDVLICEGGEVGRTAIWNEDMTECYFQKALHRGRPNIKYIIPIYILHLMWMYSKYGGFKNYVSSVTIAHLTGEKLKSMTIPVPPIELQNKFASIVEQVEQTKQKMHASLDEMDNHFNALMQRYFG